MRAIPQQLPDKHIALHLPKDITDEEIDELIRLGMPRCMELGVGIACAVYGYDFDERELYEIPEAVAMAKRLVDRGFIAIMHVSTLQDREEKPYLRKLFGAIEIWAMASGRLDENGNLFLAEEETPLFLADLDKANKKAGAIAFPTIKDGQHRTKVIR